MDQAQPQWWLSDRKSTRLNSSHTVIYTLSLHDALPISLPSSSVVVHSERLLASRPWSYPKAHGPSATSMVVVRSEEHTSELQSHSDLHSFPTRRSSDLIAFVVSCCSFRTLVSIQALVLPKSTWTKRNLNGGC